MLASLRGQLMQMMGRVRLDHRTHLTGIHLTLMVVRGGTRRKHLLVYVRPRAKGRLCQAGPLPLKACIGTRARRRPGRGI